MEDQASDKAINRISPELQVKLDGRSATQPKVRVLDGKVTCPGCSRVAVISSLGAAASVVRMPATCEECGTKFIIDASSPDGSPGFTEPATGPPPETPPTAHVLLANQQSGHEHTVQLDASGKGISSRVKGHVHIVKEAKAQPADGHTHEIKKMTAGNMDRKVFVALKDLSVIGPACLADQLSDEIIKVPPEGLVDLSSIEIERLGGAEGEPGNNSASFRVEFEVTW